MRVVALRVALLACTWVGVGAWAGSAAMVCVGFALALIGLGALLAALGLGRR